MASQGHKREHNSTASNESKKGFAIILLCFFSIMIDGYDTFIFGAIVPNILTFNNPPDWPLLTPPQVGGLNSWALFGMMIGSIGVGALTDIIGRRKVILGSVAWFSVLTLWTAHAATPAIFALTRFLAGIGLGGVMPTAIATVIDFAPPRRRLLYNALMFAGHPFGGVLSAIFSGIWLEKMGFRFMLEIGAFAGFAIFVILLIFLPESVSYLVAHGKQKEAEKVARRFGVNLERVQQEELASSQEAEAARQRGGSHNNLITFLLDTQWRIALVLFVVAAFASMMLLYGLSTWLPNIMKQQEYNLGGSNTFLFTFSAGAVTGGIVNSLVGQKIGPKKPLVLSFLLGAFAMVVLPNLPHGAGASALWNVIVFIFVFCAGYGANGTQIALNGYTGTYFPSRYRGSATGIANTGLGRLGAIFAPIMVGVLLESSLGIQWVFYAFTVPAVLGAVAILLVPAKNVHGMPETDTIPQSVQDLARS